MASLSIAEESKRVMISSSIEDECFATTLMKDLNAENIDVATSQTIPFAAGESDKKWAERKCRSTAAVIIIMSNYYQEDDECIADTNASSMLNSSTFFVKAKEFEENDWLMHIKGDSKVFDLTTSQKYKCNVKKLIASLKQLLSSQGISALSSQFIVIYSMRMVPFWVCMDGPQ